jgi:hypothetical protein
LKREATERGMDGLAAILGDAEAIAAEDDQAMQILGLADAGRQDADAEWLERWADPASQQNMEPATRDGLRRIAARLRTEPPRERRRPIPECLACGTRNPTPDHPCTEPPRERKALDEIWERATTNLVKPLEENERIIP